MTPTHTAECIPEPSSVHTPPVVLVVDDDISVRESLEAMIRLAGFRVETFASAQAFLECPRATALTVWYWTSAFPISAALTCRT